MSKPRIAVIIPCFNEEHTIASVVGDFNKELPEATIYVYDNNSTDETSSRAAEAGAIVRQEYRQGKGYVVRSMFHEIEADYYLMVDGDSTYPAERAKELLAPLYELNAHMTVGARLESSSEGAFRALHQLGNHMITGIINNLFQAHLTDVLSGFRGFSRDFVKTTPLLSSGFEIESELTLHALAARRKIVEIPVHYKNRPTGSISKLNTFRDGYLILGTILSIFKDYRPLQFFGIFSFISMISGLTLGAPVILEYFQFGIVTRIPTSILAASLVMLSLNFLGIGLILNTMARDRSLAQELWMLAHGNNLDETSATDTAQE